MVACFQQLTFFIRYVVVKVHGSWMEFREYFRQQVLFIPKMNFRDLCLAFTLTPPVFCPLTQDGEKRLLAFTKRGTAIHSVSCPISTPPMCSCMCAIYDSVLQPVF